jgi:type IV secretion system protein VirB9
MSIPTIRRAAAPANRESVSTAVILVATLGLAGCATTSPQISYDASVPPLPTIRTGVTDTTPKPVLVPPAWTPAKGGDPATTPAGRVENANKAARVEPRKEGYFNAIQIYPWSDGALYQVYAAPGQITDIALGRART